jgi:predicted ABC-type ATPase
MPEIYVFGGCNGSGETTLATTILSSFENQLEFVNADLIAAELNPNNVEAEAIQASRLMLERLNTLSRQKADFAFETTLAARTFARFLRQCQAQRYRINLVYVWLESAELAVNRVARRVASGGHNIPEDIISRRYERGRNNFVELYSPIADYWIVYDNTGASRNVIAEKTPSRQVTVYQPLIWQQIIGESL